MRALKLFHVEWFTHLYPIIDCMNFRSTSKMGSLYPCWPLESAVLTLCYSVRIPLDQRIYMCVCVCDESNAFLQGMEEKGEFLTEIVNKCCRRRNVPTQSARRKGSKSESEKFGGAGM